MSNSSVEDAPRLLARGVEKVFRSGDGALFEALCPTTLGAEPGTLALIGPSGCGKTTLLMIMAGLESPTAGQMLVDGVEVSGPYDGLGIVFQRDLLLPWRSVINNVLVSVELHGWSRKEYYERACEVLDLVGLGAFKDRFPRQLSGGMRQRVAVARALITEPSVLLMDEPFAALDALTRERIAHDVRTICERVSATCVLVTHSIEEAVFMGDRVAVMSPSPGRVVAIEDIALGRHRSAELRRDRPFIDYTLRLREIFESYGVL